jgi:hypothetical protein
VTNTQRRDETLRRAISAGKFSAARVPYWRDAWDRDPAGVEATIAGLATADPATVADPADATVSDDEMARLFPGSYRSGEQSGGAVASAGVVSEDEMVRLFGGNYHPMVTGDE